MKPTDKLAFGTGRAKYPPLPFFDAKLLLSKPWVQDCLIAAALTATSLVGAATHLRVDLPEGGGDVNLRSLDVLGVALLLLQTATLAWRRRAPALVLMVVTASIFLYSTLGYFRSFASFGFLIALYTIAAHRNRRLSVPAGIGGALIVLLILVIGREPIEPDTIIAEFLIVGAAWFIGDGFRIRRGQFEQLADRAARLEQAGEEIARHAVVEERRVIARELHDVVAHNVSVIVAQAGAAQQIRATAPEEAFGALGAIERTGREALVEMRRLMGFLRTESEQTAMLAPQPGLQNLSVLVDQVRDAGLSTVLTIEGIPRPVPPGLDLSAFRIVQEALTNILKHASAAQAEVAVQFEESRLVLVIDDNGCGARERDADASRPKYGHLGMRERIGLFGGELHVGARPGGGYRVKASLPLDSDPS